MPSPVEIKATYLCKRNKTIIDSEFTSRKIKKPSYCFECPSAPLRPPLGIPRRPLYAETSCFRSHEYVCLSTPCHSPSSLRPRPFRVQDHLDAAVAGAGHWNRVHLQTVVLQPTAVFPQRDRHVVPDGVRARLSSRVDERGDGPQRVLVAAHRHAFRDVVQRARHVAVHRRGVRQQAVAAAVRRRPRRPAVSLVEQRVCNETDKCVRLEHMERKKNYVRHLNNEPSTRDKVDNE